MDGLNLNVYVCLFLFRSSKNTSALDITIFPSGSFAHSDVEESDFSCKAIDDMSKSVARKQ